MIDIGEAAAAIGAPRAILDWRDRHLMAATLMIARACQDVRPVIEEKLAAVTWRSALTEADAFIAREIYPVVAEAVNDAARRVIAAAQDDLDRLVAHQLAAQAELSGTPGEADAMAGTVDLIAGLAPLMGGIGVAAAVPGMAIVTGAAFFGLVATATDRHRRASNEQDQGQAHGQDARAGDRPHRRGRPVHRCRPARAVDTRATSSRHHDLRRHGVPEDQRCWLTLSRCRFQPHCEPSSSRAGCTASARCSFARVSPASSDTSSRRAGLSRPPSCW